ncbi:hypothetical protein CH354_03095 [Leptospira levettii]|nr:hypothetical protein CH354_03095 [Leptospira levettii]PJZ89278.1 hypothetical protein CH368_07245 [Leptospira levettii]PKA01016.1 hypothetical protein CH369_04230 [Leptospira levettii]
MEKTTWDSKLTNKKNNYGVCEILIYFFIINRFQIKSFDKTNLYSLAFFLCGLILNIIHCLEQIDSLAWKM